LSLVTRQQPLKLKKQVFFPAFDVLRPTIKMVTIRIKEQEKDYWKDEARREESFRIFGAKNVFAAYTAIANINVGYCLVCYKIS